MLIANRKSGLNLTGDRVLIYAALFLLCALISSFGAGTLAALSFLPAALAIELISRYRGEKLPGREFLSHSQGH